MGPPRSSDDRRIERRGNPSRGVSRPHHAASVFTPNPTRTGGHKRGDNRLNVGALTLGGSNSAGGSRRSACRPRTALARCRSLSALSRVCSPDASNSKFLVGRQGRLGQTEMTSKRCGRPLPLSTTDSPGPHSASLAHFREADDTFSMSDVGGIAAIRGTTSERPVCPKLCLSPFA